MISIDLIRNDPVFVQKQLSLKDNSISLDTILKLDQTYRVNLSSANDLRSKRNKVSEDIAKAKRAGENVDDDIEAMRQVGDKIKKTSKKKKKKDKKQKKRPPGTVKHTTATTTTDAFVLPDNGQQQQEETVEYDL